MKIAQAALLVQSAVGVVDYSSWTSKSSSPNREVPLNDGQTIKFDYYIKEFTNPDDSSQVIYELHGNCIVENASISEWVLDESNIECLMGLYKQEAESSVDWMQLTMAYKGDGLDTWTCKDGASEDPAVFTFAEDTVSNCVADTEKSYSTYEEDGLKATFGLHWNRLFDTEQESQDVKLMPEDGFLGSFQVKLPGDKVVEKTEVKLCLKMDSDLCGEVATPINKDSASNLGAYSILAAGIILS